MRVEEEEEEEEAAEPVVSMHAFFWLQTVKLSPCV